jgi:hypothetical protein
MFGDREDRLPYIELWLINEGTLNPKEYAKRMGLSTDRARQDFRAYEALTPNNKDLVYSLQKQTYTLADDFKSCFIFDEAKKKAALKHGWLISGVATLMPASESAKRA